MILGHNREEFWEIPESILGKISSIIDAGLHDTHNFTIAQNLTLVAMKFFDSKYDCPLNKAMELLDVM